MLGNNTPLPDTEEANRQALQEFRQALEDGSVNLDKMLAANAATVEACATSDATKRLWQQVDDRLFIKSYGLSAKVGQQSFNYIDPVAFDEVDTEKTIYAFGVFGRLQWGDVMGGRSIHAAVELKRSFNENDRTTECRGPDNERTCLEAVFGPPRAQNDFIARLEYADVTDIELIGGQKLAYRVNVNYDIDNDIFGIDAPIFLYRDSNNLGAGFRAGWRDDTDDLRIGFFISRKFSL